MKPKNTKDIVAVTEEAAVPAKPEPQAAFTPSSDTPPPSGAGALLGQHLLAGLYGQAPTPVDLQFMGTAEEADLLHLADAKATCEFIAEFSQIPPDNRIGRLNLLVGHMLLLGSAMSMALARTLRGFVAMFLFLRDGLHLELLDGDNRPLYSSDAEFKLAFARHFRLTEDMDHVERMLACAALWTMLVENGLPYPSTLGRLRRLVTLESLETALWCYADLVKAAGNQLPSPAAIDAAVDQWLGIKVTTPKKDGRSWVKEMLADQRMALGCLQGKTVDVKSAIVLVEKTCHRLAARCEKKGAKKAARGKRARAPTKACPLSLQLLEGRYVELDLAGAESEVVEAVRFMAQSLNLEQVEDRVWQVTLPTRRSAAVAKQAQVREWVTRVLERLDYQGPDEIIAA